MKFLAASTIRLAMLLVVTTLFFQCTLEQKKFDKETYKESSVEIENDSYGKMADGTVVEKYILKNAKGMKIEVITYGGIITSWTAPNRNGTFENIVLGFDSLNQYVIKNPFFGALVGRYGNRIAKGKFSIDGNEYTLATNNAPNHLHGGLKGFDKVIWTASEIQSAHGAALKLTYLSKDGEGGYPGNLNTSVIYALTNENTLEVSYEASTDKKTVVNLTQHSYFNLSGDFSKNILDHELMIDADQYLPVDETLIPIGKLDAVQNTPFDFRKAKSIGKDIEIDNDQLSKGNGYDHCWILKTQNGFRNVASVYHPTSGRYLEISTNEPGIQFYCGNFLDGTLPTSNGGTYAQRTGFCLETQHYPDSPNQSSFPSVILEPGEHYRSKTTFKFSTK